MNSDNFFPFFHVDISLTIFTVPIRNNKHLWRKTMNTLRLTNGLAFQHFNWAIKAFSDDLCNVSPREYWLLLLPVTQEGTLLCSSEQESSHVLKEYSLLIQLKLHTLYLLFKMIKQFPLIGEVLTLFKGREHVASYNSHDSICFCN